MLVKLMWRRLALAPVAVLLAAGCRVNEAIKINTVPLVNQKNALKPPEVPALRTHRPTPEDYANKGPFWEGTSAPVVERQKKVAVVGAVEEIAERDRVAKYVSDALLRQLKDHDVQIVEREYAKFLTDEADRVEQGKAKGATAADTQRRYGELIAADYEVFVHVVRDNTRPPDPVRPQEYELIPYSTNEDEEKYRADCEKYYKDYQEYVEAVQRFNDSLLSMILTNTQEMMDKGVGFTLDGDRMENDYLAALRETRRKALEDALRNRKGLEPIEPRPRAVLANPEHVRFIGTIYQLSVSVRVVDMATSKVVWFGVAEAQNLSQIQAVNKCAQAIVDKLVVK